MTHDSSDPERWTGRAPGNTALEDQFGRALRVVAEFSGGADAPVRAPVWLQQPSARISRWQLLLVSAASAILGGAVWATVSAWHGQSSLAPEVQPAQAPPAREVPSPPAPTRAQAPVAPVLAPHGETSRQPAPVARPSEGALLWSAFRRLRREQDARGALRLFEAHRRHYPQGALALEAALGRAEALLALGRRVQAEAVIDALPAAVAARARQRLGLPVDAAR